MNAFIDWLMRDEQQPLYESVVALALTAVFLGVCALALGLMGQLVFVARLAQGFVVLWAALKVIEFVFGVVMRLFRINMHNHWQVYVGAGALTCAALQAGWGAYVARGLPAFASGAALYLAGFVSCFVASVVIGSVYTGTIYRLVSLVVGAVSFVAFAFFAAL